MAAPEYRFLTLNPSYAPNGDRIVAELPLEQVAWNRVLSGAGSFSAKLNVRHSTAIPENLRAGYHQLAVERNGEIKWCGPLWTVQTSIDHVNDPYLTLGANEWFSWFLPVGDTTRAMDYDAPIEWDTMDQIRVAEDAIVRAQEIDTGTAPNADIGVTVATDNELSGITRDMGAYVAENFTAFGNIVTDMAEKIDGFDFLIECEWDVDLLPTAQVRKTFHTYYPRKTGRSPGGIDSQSPMVGASATWDATRMGTHIAGQGDGLDSTFDVFTDYWRRDLVRKWGDIDDQGVLDAQTQAASGRYGRPIALPSIRLLNNVGIDWLDNFELGWLLAVTVNEGYMQINSDMRIVGYTVAYDQGTETIEFMLNYPEETA